MFGQQEILKHNNIYYIKTFQCTIQCLYNVFVYGIEYLFYQKHKIHNLCLSQVCNTK